MIFSQIPYRISLFGGGTDFPEWFNKHEGLVILLLSTDMRL